MSKDKEISILSIGHENETVSMAQQGNMKAFEHLVTLYEGYVYNLCYNVFYNALDAQDATQEIFVKIYKNINSFKFNSQFKTWVYKIAINTCIDEYNRKKKRIFEIFDGEEPETYDIPDKKGKNPEQILEEKELRNDLKDIIKSKGNTKYVIYQRKYNEASSKVRRIEWIRKEKSESEPAGKCSSRSEGRRDL